MFTFLKKAIFIAFVTFHTATAIAGPAENPMCVFDKTTTAADLKKYLAGKYPDSYKLQETLFDGNMQALDQLCRNQSVMEPYQVNLIDGLIKKYYPSFHLIKTLYDSNVESYNKLHNQ